MGIYHFFGWFKNQFSGNIQKLSSSQKFEDVNVNVQNLMIDMNGIFHNSSQKIYKYGMFKPKENLGESKKIYVNNRNQVKVFEDICITVDNLVKTVNPKKSLILCIDGPAPYAKIIQQKRRRFKTSLEREDDKTFDSNQITPGTKFMDYLSKYIDWYIRKKITEDEFYKDIDIIFSNEKVEGEGEAKCISYIRKYGNKDESYCIYGSDADLIMLSLGTHYSNFYILRDDIYDRSNKYFIINISNTALQLGEIMRWKSEKFEYCPQNAIDDFIFLCFMVGNDFLPHIPSLEIIESGIDIILSVYRETGTFYGHITKSSQDDIYFIKESLKAFFENISSYEKPILEKKLKNRRLYFKDEILENCASIEKDSINLDIDKYRNDYFEKYFKDEDMSKICYSYLTGLDWIIKYYKKGVPDWRWYYPYNYAPPANILTKYIETFNHPKYNKNKPLLPFQQLLAVLPPKSSELLPYPLNDLLKSEDDVIKEFYPENFEIDLAGKKNDWQGVVIIPIIKPENLINLYSTISIKINEVDNKRNIFGKSFVYRYNKDINSIFNSYYGIIYNCKVKTTQIYI